MVAGSYLKCWKTARIEEKTLSRIVRTYNDSGSKRNPNRILNNHSRTAKNNRDCQQLARKQLNFVHIILIHNNDRVDDTMNVRRKKQYKTLISYIRIGTGSTLLY